MPWLLTFGAIGCEIAATLALRATRGHLHPLVVVVVVGYVTSFFLLGLALRHLGVGVVYAVWSGVGTAVVAVAGWALFGDRISRAGMVGLAVTIAGVLVLCLSGTPRHG